MKRCVIFGAAPVQDIAALKPWLHEDDYYIAADGGIRLAEALHVHLHGIVSDCDSACAPQTAFMRLPTEKDITDMRAAMDMAFAAGCRELILLGALGGRLDHTIANLLAARQFTEQGCHVVLADAHNEMTVLLPGTYTVSAAGYRFVSFFSMSEQTENLTLRHFQYALDGYTLRADDPLCVSNAVMTDQSGEVSFTAGVLLMIFSKD